MLLKKRKRLSIAKIDRSGYNTNRQTLSIIFIKERSEIMEKSIIFFDVDGTLVVDYTLSVSYSTEASDQQFTHIYTIDLSTGELLKEE